MLVSSSRLSVFQSFVYYKISCISGCRLDQSGMSLASQVKNPRIESQRDPASHLTRGVTSVLGPILFWHWGGGGDCNTLPPPPGSANVSKIPPYSNGFMIALAKLKSAILIYKLIYSSSFLTKQLYPSYYMVRRFGDWKIYT